MSISKYYDVIISGGGMVGSVLACKLASSPILSGISILLIEARKRKTVSLESEYSNRVSAVSNSSIQLLQSAGVWDIISTSRYKPVIGMKVWGNGSKDLATRFNKEDSKNELAYIIENDFIIDAAFKRLEKTNVDVIHGTPAREYQLPSDYDSLVHVNLKDSTSYECSLLLGAEGRNSKIQKQMGHQCISWNYEQRSIVATLKLCQDITNETAWQKFTETGTIALLPLHDDVSSLVWTTNPAHAKDLLSLPEESFVDALNAALWEEPKENLIANKVTEQISSFLKFVGVQESQQQLSPPTVTSIVQGSRASFTVGFSHSTRYVAPRVAILGDSAHRIHPLAGQGVNLGFGDIRCLVKTLEHFTSSGFKLGNYQSLVSYESERQRFNLPRMVAIDLIQKVMGNSSTPLITFANSAFQLSDAFPQLKRYLVRQASL